MILKEKIHYYDSKKLCFENQYNDSKRLCFDVDPQAQLDTGVPNIVKILRDNECYPNKSRAPFQLKDAPLDNFIVPAAQRWLWVQTNTKQGYHFTSTLMYDSQSLTIAYKSDNGFRECYDHSVNINRQNILKQWFILIHILTEFLASSTNIFPTGYNNQVILHILF